MALRCGLSGFMRDFPLRMERGACREARCIAYPARVRSLPCTRAGVTLRLPMWQAERPFGKACGDRRFAHRQASFNGPEDLLFMSRAALFVMKCLACGALER